MMELKIYQQNALEAFSHWLEELSEAQKTSTAAIEALGEQAGMDEILNKLRNYPETAWQNLKQKGGVASTAGDYISRTDDAKRPIPHVCFKVPTGGGKTLLAASALERLHRQRGLTLWDRANQGDLRTNKSSFMGKATPLS